MKTASVSATDEAYPESWSDMTVGLLDGAYGEDGGRRAAISFARGRFAFEVVATFGGTPLPSDAKTILESVAEAVPATQD